MRNGTALLNAGIVLAVVALGVAALVLTTPDAVARGRFLVIPGGWLRFLLGFVLITGGIALAAYLYGRATRPGKAAQFAWTAATHLFIWMAIILVVYPVVYLLAVSFNRNDTIAATLPTEGNILFRSGVLPDPTRISTIQYERVLGETHLFWYQWLLVGVLLLAVTVLAGLYLAQRMGGNPYRLERLRTYAGWATFLSAAALVVSIQPAQFYRVGTAGEIIRSSGERKMLLFIRNTLLVSGATAIFAVLISTTAGYAFARMRFQGRYQTLLGFVFIQMFPGFMALVAIFYLMSYLGLLNNYIGLILAYSGGAIAFASWIFKGYLESISPSLEEAALVDGATRWGAFWRIILPISLPMLLFIFLLQFIGTYSEFILASVLLTGEDRWTVGIALRTLTFNQFNIRWGTLTASAVLGSIPILVIFYAFQNALTGQHTAGGVKG
jgi:arabinogalactan oligomer/maltooligosaccharide transport system permease protein